MLCFSALLWCRLGFVIAEPEAFLRLRACPFAQRRDRDLLEMQCKAADHMAGLVIAG
jgi:hypothetical protein